MRHINALLNPSQLRNLQKALDLAIFEVDGNNEVCCIQCEHTENELTCHKK